MLVLCPTCGAPLKAKKSQYRVYHGKPKPVTAYELEMCSHCFNGKAKVKATHSIIWWQCPICSHSHTRDIGTNTTSGICDNCRNQIKLEVT